MTGRRCTVDVGNSSVGVGCWDGDRLQVIRRAGPGEAAAAIRGEAVAVSVSPSRLAALVAALPPDVAATLRVLRAPPPELGVPELLDSAGADRIANALALAPGPGIAVDAGTAVTVDAVDRRGRFLGGCIAPGPAAAAAGLAGATAQLPRLPGEPVTLALGTETRAAIAAGVWGLAVGGVDRLVDVALAALGEDPVRIVATGSWGAAWAAASRHRGVQVDDDLVHRGIARWAGWT